MQQIPPHIINSSLVDLYCTRELFAEHNGFSTACADFYCPTPHSFVLPADVTGACDVGLTRQLPCARLPHCQRWLLCCGRSPNLTSERS
jgi:hypothetical protein